MSNKNQELLIENLNNILILKEIKSINKETHITFEDINKNNVIIFISNGNIEISNKNCISIVKKIIDNTRLLCYKYLIRVLNTNENIKTYWKQDEDSFSSYLMFSNTETIHSEQIISGEINV